jgi:hypothetical protein
VVAGPVDHLEDASANAAIVDAVAPARLSRIAEGWLAKRWNRDDLPAEDIQHGSAADAGQWTTCTAEQRHPLKLGEMDRVYEIQKWAPRARSGRQRQTAA